MLTFAFWLIKPVLTKMMDAGYPMLASIVSMPHFNTHPTLRAFTCSAVATYTYLRASGRIP